MANQIPVSALIASFQLMEAERWAYEWGAAKRGLTDCAGAFVWAYKQHGLSIYQGSNRIARVEVDQLLPICSARIVPGMVAFKSRKPGEKGYDLPDKYKPGGAYYNGDVTDYYHIGLVDADTSIILNAQSAATGFVASQISKGWTHVAYLKQVDYGEETVIFTPSPEPDPNTASTPSGTVATVYAANGLPVKMRSQPSESCRNWEELPVGTIVTVRGPDRGGWTPIRYNGKDWHMMTKYLVMSAAQPDHEQPEGAVDSEETFTSYAVEFYDLTFSQAVALQSLAPDYKSRLKGRNG